MIKMAAMHINGKQTFKNLLRNQWTDIIETWFVASRAQAVIVYTIEDSRLTLSYFSARSQCVSKIFSVGNRKNSEFFRNYYSL